MINSVLSVSFRISYAFEKSLFFQVEYKKLEVKLYSRSIKSLMSDFIFMYQLDSLFKSVSYKSSLLLIKFSNTECIIYIKFVFFE